MAALTLPLLLLLLLGSGRGTPQTCPKNPQTCPKNSPGTEAETTQSCSENSPGNGGNSGGIEDGNEQLLVLTVATEATDGYRRFLRSARAFNYSVQTLGLGHPWRGGDISRSPGGGQKVRWLRGALAPLRGRGGLVLLFVDSYDVLLAAGPRELLAKFRASGAGVLFAAEGFCWPQEGLAPLYPPCPPGGKPFLNSGGFVGFAPALWALVERWRFRDDDDDQLFYSQLYLDRELREELSLALDHHSQIFQNLNGALDEVTIRFEPGGNRVRNEISGAWPVVIHGNGPTKVALNSLGNYVPQGWSPGGCGDCERDLRPLRGTPPQALPWVLIGVFVAEPTPFLPQFLRRLGELSYPRERLGLFLHNAVPAHSPLIDSLWPRLRRRFSSAHREGEGLGGGAARDLGMSLCRRDPRCDHYLSLDSDVSLSDQHLLRALIEQNSLDSDVSLSDQHLLRALIEQNRLTTDHYLSLDSDVSLSDQHLLRALIEQNRQVLAPLLTRPGHLWSNFWGALGPDGYYSRAPDYLEIVQGRRRGVWNVPYVSHAYLVGGAALRGPLGEGPVFDHAHLDPDMAFCARAREKGLFLHVTNRRHFGHLLVTDGYNGTGRRHPELWERLRNPWDWDQQYLHPNFSRVLQEHLIQQPCPDVFQFPLFSEQFGRELREEAELRGGWAEHHEVRSWAVPLSALQLDPVLQGALRELLPPIARRLFPGYAPKGRTVLSSVVRYDPAPSGHAHPDPAPSATPPRPSATISLRVSLSPALGGGWLFPRYGCAAPAPPPGWALLHPGRLTHLGTGVTPVGGARYSLELLLDP
ncbi:multifunctional procollagen lysine hydroxylase and glycosyltransferase LH3-like [Oenanthe melanoleuca]|uniref:multifunctional procollagen lysine hydroxylase and glycosyltransferase LH3-like n=1 Tax=Oenanthe melanoleuca TaxID=2939378 RepID=UPI0024C102A4|nr:multifunctional procollagen lysine hydroxylase and glycosyltransferase LH3-like [Oenanthe melanoleuca]